MSEAAKFSAASKKPNISPYAAGISGQTALRGCLYSASLSFLTCSKNPTRFMRRTRQASTLIAQALDCNGPQRSAPPLMHD
ncbi:MAG: hypothetical protein IPK17_28435 [Chloroflexi bacterium]|uniref:hypothetical protein n=1 Tax=Candidatus Flexifilum breve TaxID=3140694 RepID=UPI0031349A57|nr:hypothetical protein [Chloroflexota bacterium]